MDRYYVIDTEDYKLPDASGMKKEYSVMKDAEGKKYLEIEVDVTHGGYVNGNKYFYTCDGMAKGVASFFTPYPKPVLAHHISEGTPIGRSYSAAYIPLSAMADPKKKDDLAVPKSKIRVRSIITDEKAIEDIFNRTYLTVSSGGYAKEPPRCSICDTPVESMGPLGNVSGCDHRKGKKYDVDGTEKECYWIIGEMEYKEYSFVNNPADYSPEHYASVVRFRFVTPDEAKCDGVSLEGLNFSESILSNNIQDKIEDKTNIKEVKDEIENNDKNNQGGIKMELKDIELFISQALDIECPGCTDDEIKWENENEIKEAEQLDIDFCEAMKVIFGIDDKVLPPAGSKERHSMKTTFCGPNKTFPIPDCKHAAVAMAMLKWPRVVAKYSASARASIASCVRSRAKTLNCPMAKKKDNSEQVKILTDEVNKIKTDLQEKESELKKANDRIQELSGEIKKRLAEKVVDLSIMVKRSSVKDMLAEADEAKRKEKYDKIVEDYMKREVVSLTDTIKDLGGEVIINIDSLNKIDDPTIKSDNINDVKDDKKEKKNWLLKHLGFID